MNTLKDRFFRESKPSGDIRVVNFLKVDNSTTLDLFRYQARKNPVYAEYIRLIGCDPEEVSSPDQIPFLPVESFKTHRVVTGPGKETLVFRSSGTTGHQASLHYILDEKLYEESFTRCFKRFFGDPASYCFLALLPSYLLQRNSSLVYMADRLIRLTGHPGSGFYLDDLQKLSGTLEGLESSGQKTILMGVSYALMDFAERFPMKLRNTRIIETGGMKGRRKEVIRAELHEILQKAFEVPAIGSEYGMTELLSQAWSLAHGIFEAPPWMRIFIRDPYNPFRHLPAGKTGGIDIIDLANRDSCAFIQTGDLGKLNEDGSFEVLGRLDQSDVRGCNLMTAEG